MKRLFTILFCLMGCIHLALGQCTNAPSGQWPSSSVTLNATTTPTNLTTCAFTGEYSTVTNVQSGKSYTVTSSIATNYITVTLINGTTIVAHGPQPLTFTTASSVDLRIYRHDDAACGTTASGCRTINMTCNDCNGGGSGCTNTTQFPSSSVAINTGGSISTISSCNYAGEYSVITGAVTGQTLRFTYSLSGGYITVRSGSSSGPVVAQGNSPLSFSNTFTGTLYAHWNTSSACGSNSTCSTTTVQCTSCTPPPPPTCPGGLGAGTVNIASLPYNGVGLTNCGNGNNITSANATVCGSSSYYGGEDRTFIFTPIVSGLYDIVFTTTSTWSGLMLYAGCPFLGQGGTCVTNSQSSTGNKTLNVNLTSGTTYYLVVDAFPSPSCHPSFNLSIALAIPPCSPPGIPTVSNISSTSASVNWSAAMGATSYDWTVGTGGSCPTGTGANTAATSLSLSGLVPNTTYRVCVRTSTCGGGAASGYMTTTFTTLPLPNDNCSGAIQVSCNSTVNGSTVGATSNSGMGSCAAGTGGTPGNGVWYRLNGDGSQVTLNLCNSSYDTKVHVYEGSSCAGLTCVASNDDSGFCSNTLRSYVVFNANPGSTYYILVSGFSSNTGAFSMDISCVCGPPLGAPWTTSGLGGASGEAIDNVCGGSIDMSSNGPTGSTADKMYVATQFLCGNESIIARLDNVTNAGQAGVMFRESNVAGSKMVGLAANNGYHMFRRVRSVTNGAVQIANQFRPNHSWLRIDRSGNSFVGYTSHNGMQWSLSFQVMVPMNSCVEVGLFVYSPNQTTTSTAVFTDVQIGSGGQPVNLPATEVLNENVAGMEKTVYPNPASNQLFITTAGLSPGTDLEISILNSVGQVVQYIREENVRTDLLTLNVRDLSPGVYLLNVVSSSGVPTTHRVVISR